MKKHESDPVTTLSARFEEAEIAKLREAAEARQWSLSQLIRAGAYEKAVNILNTRHIGVFGVQRLLERVAEQLFAPKVMVDPGPPGEATVEFDNEMLNPGYFDFPEHVRVHANPFDFEVGPQLADVMRKFGAELSTLFLKEVMRVTAADTKVELLDPHSPPSSVPEGASEQAADADTGAKEKQATRGRRRSSRAKSKEL